MFSIRSRPVPPPGQAPVALETASTVVAPLSIAVLTLSLVTARQIHANTPTPLLSSGLVWLGYPNLWNCAPVRPHPAASGRPIRNREAQTRGPRVAGANEHTDSRGCGGGRALDCADRWRQPRRDPGGGRA